MTVGLVLQVVLSGLAAGAAYGLVGMGFALVYRLTGVLQLAHGDLVAASAFLVVALGAGGQEVAATASGLVPALLAIAIVAAAGPLLYRGILRPMLREGTAVGWIGATLALAVAIEGTLLAVFPREAYVVPDPLPRSLRGTIGLGGGASVSWRVLVVLAIGGAVAFATTRLLDRSKLGKALGAIASDPQAAQTVGLPVDRLVAIAFAIAGGLAAIAAVLVAPDTAVSPQSGVVLGLKGIAAAMLARMARPVAVAAWGLAIGVIEQAVATLHVPGFPSLALGPAWRDVAPLLLVVVVLAARPGALRESRTE